MSCKYRVETVKQIWNIDNDTRIEIKKCDDIGIPSIELKHYDLDYLSSSITIPFEMAPLVANAMLSFLEGE